ncbi:hypothetical protein Tco_0162858 [Tanacetum coccineum]
MVGALMYLTTSRPDIVHATCYCARYQAKPTKKHLTAVKRIFRYLKDSINMGLWYPKRQPFQTNSFVQIDHAGCLDSRKSTSGGIQFLGGDKLVSWSSKKQDCTSMSSAEAESYALSWKPCQGDSLNLPDHRYRILTKGRKTKSNRTKPSTDSKRAEKSKVMDVSVTQKRRKLTKNGKFVNDNDINLISSDDENILPKHDINTLDHGSLKDQMEVSPLFHGQLYVAVLRVKSKKGLKVLCCDKEGKYTNHTTNVVYREVLHRL